MMLKRKELFSLLEIIFNCPFLLALHLSDNGITKDEELFYDVLEEFHIREEDLVEINRSKRMEVKVNPKNPRKYDKLDIDYTGYLKEYFNFKEFVKDHEGHNNGCSAKKEVRKLYKDKILLGK